MTGWPWPLSAVQGFFEGMWSGLVSTVSGAAQWVWDKVWNGILWLKDRVWEFLQFVGSRIQESITWLWNQITGGLTWVWDKLRELGASIINAVLGGIPAVGKLVEDFIKTITNSFNAGLNWLLERIGSVVAPIQSAVVSAVSQLSDMLRGILVVAGQNVTAGLEWLGKRVSEFVDGISNRLQAGIEWLANVVRDVGNSVSQGIGQGIQSVADTVGKGLSAAQEVMLNAFQTAQSVIADTLVKLVQPFWQTATQLQLQTWQTLTQNIVNNVVNQNIQAINTTLAIMGTIGQTSSKQDPFRAYALQNQILDQTKAAWFSQAIANILAEVATVGQLDISIQSFLNSPDMQVLLDAYKRIYQISMDAQLFQPLQLAYNYAFQPALPTPSDMIRFMVKEAYLPEKQIEFPQQFEEWMKFLGYSPEWTRLFWGSHWQLPSVTQVFTMLHRKLITPEQVDAYLKLADIEPAWRPLLRAISYELPDRIRTRWMFEWGLIDLNTWKELDEMTGLDPRWAEVMVKAELRNILRDDINAIRSQLDKAVREGLMSIQEYRQYLTSLGLPKEVVEARAAAVEIALNTELRIEQVKAIRQAYVDKKIDENEYVTSLARLGVSASAIAAFTYTDTLKREPKPIPAMTVERQLADIQDRIRKHELSLQFAREDLQAAQNNMTAELQAIEAELEKKLADIDDRLRVLQARYSLAKNQREITIITVEIQNALAEKAQIIQLYQDKYNVATVSWQNKILQLQQKIRETELELAILRDRLTRLSAGRAVAA